MADTQSDETEMPTKGRTNFSCSNEVWSEAKKQWQKQIRQFPTWAGWLDAAFASKTARKRAELGLTEYEPAPDRLPPGRRVPPEQAGTRPRRSYSGDTKIMADARATWWAEAELYPAWSDWAEEALAEQLPRRETTPATPTESADTVAAP
ncbi:MULTISPECIES: hypothetical protein [Nocardia]|uniref:hypothetical protein n=1 Tax=Nocardia TaxID=1817 RepID=UPI000836A353|nr:MULTISPECIES: hypothetical protein [Nocardia]MBC7302093.1 hypothetical protein [Nocardia sp.]